MRWSYNLDRSRSVAVWLFTTALLIVAITVVGGATRLTGSGLSITEWRPIMGAVPPLNSRAWLETFAKYKLIPQYELINRGMSLDQFKFIFWWEWAHRLIARLIGVVFLVPLLVFLILRRIPRRLTGRCWILFALGGLQGAVGWWMVSSGLSERVAVAPERLATHLGLALFIYAFAVWTGLEAWSGQARPPMTPRPRLSAWSAGLIGLIFVQILLGALVAGNHAGLIYNDWPLMNGRWFPEDYAHGGVWGTIAHSRAAVQFNHRMVAYLVLLVAIGLAVASRRARDLAAPARVLALLLAAAVTAQVVLGVLTLRLGATLPLSLAHQIWAVLVLTVALTLTWRIRRD